MWFEVFNAADIVKEKKGKLADIMVLRMRKPGFKLYSVT